MGLCLSWLSNGHCHNQLMMPAVGMKEWRMHVLSGPVVGTFYRFDRIGSQ